MGNKRLKKKIEGLRKQIRQHEDKIRKERIKNSPDEGMIKHWEEEIFSLRSMQALPSFRAGIEKIMRRLNR